MSKNNGLKPIEMKKRLELMLSSLELDRDFKYFKSGANFVAEGRGDMEGIGVWYHPDGNINVRYTGRQTDVAVFGYEKLQEANFKPLKKAIEPLTKKYI